MTIKILGHNAVFYTRGYQHDVPVDVLQILTPEGESATFTCMRSEDRVLGIAARCLLAAVPFCTFNRSLSRRVAVAMGALRLWNTDATGLNGMVRGLLALSAVAATVFQQRLGLVATTIHDIILDLAFIENAVFNGATWKEVDTQLMQIASNVVYLALIAQGGSVLSIAALVIAATTELMNCRDEWQRGRWIEAASHLLMSGLRLHQGHTQYRKAKDLVHICDQLSAK